MLATQQILGAKSTQFVSATGPDSHGGDTDGDYKYHTFIATKTGTAGFVVSNALGQTIFTFTFNTDLILGSSDPTNVNYGKNN